MNDQCFFQHILFLIFFEDDKVKEISKNKKRKLLHPEDKIKVSGLIVCNLSIYLFFAFFALNRIVDHQIK